MEEAIEKIKKSIKGDCLFINLMFCIMSGLMIYSISSIIEYARMDASRFEVKISQEEGWENLYCLYIDDENVRPIDYNTYRSVDFNGDTNVKMCVIIDEIGRAVRSLMMSLILLIAYRMLRAIIKEGSPFSKKNCKRLRIIATGIILIALVPGSIKLILSTIYFQSSSIPLSQINFFLLILGVFIGAIYEIFKYGCSLQEELEKSNKENKMDIYI